MRSKSSLSLIEQALMLLVFALCAAVCLAVFAWADTTSKNNEKRDITLVYAQNMAEVLKNTRGDYAEAAELYSGEYDGKIWRADFGEVELYAKEQLSTSPYIASACIYAENGEKLITVSWQKEAGNE